MKEEVCVLRVTNLHKSFKFQNHSIEVLKGITFEAKTGDRIVVTGPSGSGKSTLLHILGTLDSPTSGGVEINSQSPFSWSEMRLAHFRNQTIGFIFQEHYLLPHYSVLENVLLPVIGDREDRIVKRARAHVLLNRVGLSNRLEHRPSELSGGERQRVSIARSLINSPKILLCDEPTGSLDNKTANQIADLLFRVQEESHVLMIVVTHSQALAARFTRCLCLRDGRCFTTGS